MLAIVRRVTATALTISGLLLGWSAFASAAHATPYIDQPTVAVSTQNPAVGSSLNVTGDGFLPNERIDLTLHSAVYDLGTATADSAGHFAVTVILPAAVSGSHTIVAVGEISGRTSSIEVMIGSVSASGGTNGGRLPYTGAAVLGLGTIGAAFLVGGAVMLLIGARRKVTT